MSDGRSLHSVVMEAEGSLEKPRSITTPAEGIDQQHYTDSAFYKLLDGEMQKMSQIITQSHLGTSGKFFDGVVQKMSQIITQPRLVTIDKISRWSCAENVTNHRPAASCDKSRQSCAEDVTNHHPVPSCDMLKRQDYHHGHTSRALRMGILQTAGWCLEHCLELSSESRHGD